MLKPLKIKKKLPTSGKERESKQPSHSNDFDLT
jgi:hypothetical protein